MRGLPVGVPLGSRESPQRCTLKEHTRASFPTGAVFRAILPAHSNSFADFLLARTQPSYSSRLFPALGLYWELSRNYANADNKSKLNTCKLLSD